MACCKCLYRIVIFLLIAGLTVLAVLATVCALFHGTTKMSDGTSVSKSISFWNFDTINTTKAGVSTTTRVHTRDLSCHRAKVFYVTSSALIIVCIILGGIATLLSLVWIMAPCGFPLGALVMILTLLASACGIVPFALMLYGYVNGFCASNAKTKIAALKDSDYKGTRGLIFLIVCAFGFFLVTIFQILGCLCGCQLEKSERADPHETTVVNGETMHTMASSKKYQDNLSSMYSSRCHTFLTSKQQKASSGIDETKPRVRSPPVFLLSPLAQSSASPPHTPALMSSVRLFLTTMQALAAACMINLCYTPFMTKRENVKGADVTFTHTHWYVQVTHDVPDGGWMTRRLNANDIPCTPMRELYLASSVLTAAAAVFGALATLFCASWIFAGVRPALAAAVFALTFLACVCTVAVAGVTTYIYQEVRCDAMPDFILFPHVTFMKAEYETAAGSALVFVPSFVYLDLVCTFVASWCYESTCQDSDDTQEETAALVPRPRVMHTFKNTDFPISAARDDVEKVLVEEMGEVEDNLDSSVGYSSNMISASDEENPRD